MPELACTAGIVRHKKCPRCGGTLPITEFHRLRSSRDGHAPYCRHCIRRTRPVGRVLRPTASTLWQADAWTAVAQ